MATVNLGSIKFKWKGTYAGGTAYTIDDVVSYNGSSYICIQASTGNLPTDTAYFEQMSQKGTDADLLSIASTAQGDIYYNNGGAIARLGAGTSGQALITNGTGANPSWGDVSGGLVQVKSATKTDTQSFSGGTRLDITGLSVTLTPSSTSNKILVRFMVTHWGNDSHCQIERSINGGSYSIISAPTVTGNRTPTHSGGSHRDINELNTATMEVLDAPNTTSAIIYKMTFNNGPGGGNTGYINRSSADNNTDANVERAISTITAMEIASGAL